MKIWKELFQKYAKERLKTFMKKSCEEYQGVLARFRGRIISGKTPKEVSKSIPERTSRKISRNCGINPEGKT